MKWIVLKPLVYLLFLIPYVFNAQVFPKSGYDVGALIPEGYKLKDLAFGDLNADLKDDLVIVIRNNDTKKKSAAIYLYDNLKWKLETESADFFYLDQADIFDPHFTNYENFNDRNKDEEYIRLNIDSSVITINTNDGWGNSLEAKFKKITDKTYRLIGLDITQLTRSILLTNSFNYITNKMHIQTENMSDDLGPMSKTWFRVLNAKKIDFHMFSARKILSEKKSYKYEEIDKTMEN